MLVRSRQQQKGVVLKTPAEGKTNSSRVRPITATNDSDRSRISSNKKKPISLDLPRASISAGPRVNAPINEVKEPEPHPRTRRMRKSSESDRSSRKTSTVESPQISQRKRFSTSAAAVCAMVRFQKAMGPSRRTSAISSVAEKPPVRMENTFQMEPRMDQRFKLPNVHETMNEVLARYLRGYKYEPRSAQLLSKTLTNEVTRAVKSREWPRHRIICQVTMTEQKQQDMRATSRCLWNANTDTHISASYSGSNFVVLATVYAVYLD